MNDTLMSHRQRMEAEATQPEVRSEWVATSVDGVRRMVNVNDPDYAPHGED